MRQTDAGVLRDPLPLTLYGVYNSAGFVSGSDRMPFDVLVIVFTAVIIMVIVSSAPSRQNPFPADFQPCQNCGAANPPFARYCRRCGRPL